MNGNHILAVVTNTREDNNKVTLSFMDKIASVNNSLTNEEINVKDNEIEFLANAYDPQLLIIETN